MACWSVAPAILPSPTFFSALLCSPFFSEMSHLHATFPLSITPFSHSFLTHCPLCVQCALCSAPLCVCTSQAPVCWCPPTPPLLRAGRSSGLRSWMARRWCPGHGASLSLPGESEGPPLGAINQRCGCCRGGGESITRCGTHSFQILFLSLTLSLFLWRGKSVYSFNTPVLSLSLIPHLPWQCYPFPRS